MYILICIYYLPASYACSGRALRLAAAGSRTESLDFGGFDSGRSLTGTFLPEVFGGSDS